MLGQINQRRLPHFGFTPGLDFGYSLQGVIHGSFVREQAVADLELFVFLGCNGRDQIQRTLIAAVVGKTGARLQSRDIALPLGVSVFPQENTGNCRVLKPTETPRLPALLCKTVRVSPLASA